jgi:hypothetical protein
MKLNNSKLILLVLALALCGAAIADTEQDHNISVIEQQAAPLLLA